jgi:hypothetical protein
MLPDGRDAPLAVARTMVSEGSAFDLFRLLRTCDQCQPTSNWHRPKIGGDGEVGFSDYADVVNIEAWKGLA